MTIGVPIQLLNTRKVFESAFFVFECLSHYYNLLTATSKSGDMYKECRLKKNLAKYLFTQKVLSLPG